MLTLRLDANALAGTRLQASPQLEVLGWLSYAYADRPHPVAGNLGAPARWAMRDRDVRLVGALLHRARQARLAPDFLLPSQPGAGSIDEFDAIAATPAAIARRQLLPLLTHRGAGPAGQSRLDRADLPQRCAAGVSKFWSSVVKDEWPAMATHLDDHLATVARAVLSCGLGPALGRVHPRLAWTGQGIGVASERWTESVDLAGRPLTLIPTLTFRDDVIVSACGAAPPFVSYPYSCAGGRASGPPRGNRIDDLLGASRADLLRRLRVPHTTTALSSTSGLSTATVSYHLQVLYNAGLVSRERRGREVRYRITPAGERLSR